jgi:hypothetical protein
MRSLNKGDVIFMEQFLKERRIDWLMHFTRVENLPSILMHGLLPKSNLEFEDIEHFFNDKYRYDNCEDAVCTTIEFPNYKMFYPLRDSNSEWVVLLLDAKIMYDLDCAFCVTNAGTEKIYNTPIIERKGKKALLKLFDELPSGPSRKVLGIADYYPTNPQAEVLVFDCIPIKYIIKVLFENQSVLNKYKNSIPIEIEAKVNSGVFRGRGDWQYWQNRN